MPNVAAAILTFNKNPKLILFIIKLEIKVEIPITKPPITLSLNLYFAPQLAHAKLIYPFQNAIKTTLDDKGVWHFSHFFMCSILMDFD